MMTAPDSSVQRIDTPQTKIRHEWYQNDNYVIVSVFIKKVDPSSVSINFQPNTLSVSIKLANGSDYSLELDLAHETVPSDSKYEVLSTKVEIKLKKASTGLKWGVLEGDDPSLPVPMTSSAVARPSYPSSSRTGPKNWDLLDKEAAKDESDKPDGDRALNALFQQIYKDANDDVRKAMVKSFVESNGTCLSTNWDEVKQKPVETKPPEGLVAKKYDI
ncbi:SGT1, suppressor of G2 allele of SKP1 [Paraphysoderma sedebokerense]|nr:SGT1, suppressor of G2 allele of SKP1 [Paraphysoderma sedebokerense]